MWRFWWLTVLMVIFTGCMKQPVRQQNNDQAMLQSEIAAKEAKIDKLEEEQLILESRVRILEEQVLEQVSQESPQPGTEASMEKEEEPMEPGTEDESLSDEQPLMEESSAPAKNMEKEEGQPDSAIEEYREALHILRKERKFDEARNRLSKFIAAHQGHRLIPNALYWLGETYYVQKRYAQAILTFKEVTKNYPKHPKSPDSLLKIGFAYQRLDDKDNALFYLRTLVSEYPDSSSASKARKKIPQIQ